MSVDLHGWLRVVNFFQFIKLIFFDSFLEVPCHKDNIARKELDTCWCCHFCMFKLFNGKRYFCIPLKLCLLKSFNNILSIFLFVLSWSEWECGYLKIIWTSERLGWTSLKTAVLKRVLPFFRHTKLLFSKDVLIFTPSYAEDPSAVIWKKY